MAPSKSDSMIIGCLEGLSFTVMLPAHVLHGLDQTRDARGMTGITYSLSEIIYKRVPEQSISLIIAKWPETTAIPPPSSARGL